ncbi:putative secreted protein [Wickerhamomyces ciferrii]|uniref:Secreted protein n=1 Tax=Wickerhamomyces ciferrii (strain ATCC 14091 / BCRC 22168 / CBS 111 / JCM 3599 / NBRC 0793 / NRRL Y-1031 F-60-10) TaxID=1206466 RepID=K0KY48_WICCF|nr:uncharacterized protein BN7_6610 [Wickerhamomyces ciferrii]CCH47002.1 putative secreted protein [Wickerhamomyces ciferrii]
MQFSSIIISSITFLALTQASPIKLGASSDPIISTKSTPSVQPSKFPTLTIQQPVLSSNSNQFFSAKVVDKRQLN